MGTADLEYPACAPISVKLFVLVDAKGFPDMAAGLEGQPETQVCGRTRSDWVSVVFTLAAGLGGLAHDRGKMAMLN